MKKLLILVVTLSVVSVALGRSSKNSAENDVNETARKSTSYFGDAKFLYRTYQECLASDLSTCLKLKLYGVMDRIARSQNEFKVYDGVAFVKEGDEPEDNSESKTEEEVEESLPRSLEDKDKTLNSLIFDKVLSFFASHTLKVKFPSVEEMRAYNEEGRGKGGIGGGGGGGKDKKNGHYIMIPLLLGSTLVPLAFGALALLAGKALIVSKLALALASIIGIKKLISSTHHHHDSAHEVVVSGGSGGGWGRNYLTQNLAYNGYSKSQV